MAEVTKTEIANRALRLLGNYRIENMDTESGAEAQIARDVFDECRRYVLTSHEWRFAIIGKGLARAAFAPATRYGYAYPLPTDYLRIVEISERSEMVDPYQDWEIQAVDDGAGNTRPCVVCNAESVFIEYIYDHQVYAQWPPHVLQAFVVYLATFFAAGIKSVTETERLNEMFQKQLGYARGIDSTQQTARQTPPGNWLRAMRGRRF